jgi:hypothetical protein
MPPTVSPISRPAVGVRSLEQVPSDLGDKPAGGRAASALGVTPCASPSLLHSVKPHERRRAGAPFALVEEDRCTPALGSRGDGRTEVRPWFE